MDAQLHLLNGVAGGARKLAVGAYRTVAQQRQPGPVCGGSSPLLCLLARCCNSQFSQRQAEACRQGCEAVRRPVRHDGSGRNRANSSQAGRGDTCDHPRVDPARADQFGGRSTYTTNWNATLHFGHFHEGAGGSTHLCIDRPVEPGGVRRLVEECSMSLIRLDRSRVPCRMIENSVVLTS